METVGASNPQSFDLIVVGGGPAGASAAITAAKAGISVLLVERGRLPRHRVCGEFVSAESFSLLRDLLSEDPAGLVGRAPRISRGRLFIDDRVIAVPINPPAASIARYELDLGLWEAALRAGVDARLQSLAERVEGHGPFRVHIAGRDFLAQALLNTSGRWSNLTIGGQTQDAGGKRWLGVKAHFREPSPAPSVDLYFFEGGYCGVQPVRVAEDGAFCDRVNVCAMVRADVASNLEDVFVQHPAMGERCRQWRPLMEAVSTSPLVFHRPTPVLDGVFQAGDAAGFVDPFAGDGISLALRGGALAAEFITRFLHGEMSREDAEFRYREAYKQVLLPVFRNSARLRRLLRLPPAVRRPLARVLERAPALAGYLVRATR